MERTKRRNKKLKSILGIILAVFMLFGSVGILAYTFKGKSKKSLSVSTVFSENSWKTISKVFKAGKADKYWNLGDTKEIELGDGYTYEVQIVDMTPNRYALSDGTGYSNGVFQFVKCISEKYEMNSTSTNAGGWADCELRTTLNTTFFNSLPADLKEVISEVSIVSGVGGGSGTQNGISASNNKIFLASEYEIFGFQSYSLGVTEGQPQFDYWALNNSSGRVKTLVNSTSAMWYWLRSPMLSYANAFCAVNVNDSSIGLSASYTGGVCPCFAF